MTDTPDTPASGPGTGRDGPSAPDLGESPAARGEAVISPPARSGGRPKVYISGPITGLEEAVWRDRFARAEAFGLSAGWDVVNPTKLEYCPTENCGTGSRLATGEYLHHWGCYMRYDLIALLECDAIVMLPDWTQSKGARLERKIALACNMPCAGLSEDFKYLTMWHYA